MASKTVGSLTLDTPLEDCEVGVSKTITVTVTPTKNDEGGFSADVVSVEDYEEAAEEPANKPAPVPDGKGMPGPMIMIGLGHAKK